MYNFVFIGIVSYFNVPYIEDLLNKNKISFYFKDLQDSSLLAGWVQPGSTFIEKSLYIDDQKVDLIKDKLIKYITN